jgi:hypothetical protein
MDNVNNPVLRDFISDKFLNKTLPAIRSQASIRARELAKELGIKKSDLCIKKEVDQLLDEVLVGHVLKTRRKKPWKCSLSFHVWEYLEPKSEKITWRACINCLGRQRSTPGYVGENHWDWA